MVRTVTKPSAKPEAEARAVLVWDKTPLGPLWAEVDGEGALTSLHWGKAPAGVARMAEHPAMMQLSKYFNKNLEEFDVEVDISGTDFQKNVWNMIASIPYGTVATYADIARHLETHPRAVASACARNPLPLFIPCHRVIASDGRLSGYSGGDGVPTKRWLLELEGWQPTD